MLVMTLAFYAPRHVLYPPFLQNTQTFGTIVIGPDTTQQLVITNPITNNNSFGSLEVELGTPQTLAPTQLTNVNTFGALTIGPEPPSPMVTDALFLDDDDSELLITPDDYLRIQE